MSGNHFNKFAVSVEHAVHVADIASAKRAPQHCWVAVIAVATAQTCVVSHIASALFEIRHEATPFQNLGQQIRSLLARQVNTAELGDRIIAILHKDSFVELLGTSHADGGINAFVTC